MDEIKDVAMGGNANAKKELNPAQEINMLLTKITNTKAEVFDCLKETDILNHRKNGLLETLARLEKRLKDLQEPKS